MVALTMAGLASKAQTASLTNTDAASIAAVNVGTSASADVKSDAKSDDKKDKAENKSENKTVTAAEDTAWHPQRRLWGYTFGDFYYDAHSATSNYGGETNYAGVPTYRNAFQFRRLYLGYDYDITRKFKAEVLLASEPNASTGVNGNTNIQNGDNLVDNHMGFYIKNFNLRVRDLWTGTDLVIGELSTPGFALNEPGTNAPTSLSESTWGYRSIERTITDFHKNNSYDVGAALQGTFDPATKHYGYVLMVSNNTSSSLLNANTPTSGFYKIVYGDIWGKFLNNHIYADFYVHTAKTASATAAIGAQSNTMYKLFAAYLSKPVSVGAEAYTQTFVNGVTDTKTKVNQDATVHGLSLWVRGPIVKSLNFFAKWDNYNPFTEYDPTASYTKNTNWGAYDPSFKESFVTAGIDYNPTPNVHFMPNFWLNNYTDQRNAGTAGYMAPDHTLIFRFTFFVTFGK